jgi:hypothetical protein
LSEVAAQLNANADWNWEIEGYTDNVRDKAANQKLSEERATSVENWLADHGVDRSRLDAKDYGESNPGADKLHSSKAGRGMLTTSATSDLLNSASWTKWPQPVFSESPEAHAYAIGHNGFFKSPDGTQDWIIYHANPEPHQGCADFRSPRAQPFTWNTDGTPHFGTPVPLGDIHREAFRPTASVESLAASRPTSNGS